MKSKIQHPIQPDWWSKTFAGGVLGLSFSLAVGNLVVILGQPYVEMDLLAQLGMWSIPWVWMPLMFLSYFFKNGKTAVLTLALMNIAAYLGIFWLRG